MTGLAPAELLSGGRDYFDALVEQAGERRRSGYELTELLAAAVEILHAQHRLWLKLAGAKDIPEQLRVERPGGRERTKPKAVNWRVLRDRLTRRGN